MADATEMSRRELPLRTDAMHGTSMRWHELPPFFELKVNGGCQPACPCQPALKPKHEPRVSNKFVPTGPYQSDMYSHHSQRGGGVVQLVTPPY